jgi:hypothetical protein
MTSRPRKRGNGEGSIYPIGGGYRGYEAYAKHAISFIG